MEKTTFKKLLFILSSAYKKEAVWLQVLLVTGVLFESVGIGMIIPLVKVITDVEASGQNGVIRFLKSITGNLPDSQLVFIVLAAFVLFYVIKTVFLTFLVSRQSRFTQGLSRNVSTRLFRGYLHQPYSFFLDKNSGVLMKNVISEISAFTAYVQNLMYLQTEISVLTGVVVTLFILEPVGAIIVFCFIGGLSYILYSLSKKKITVWAKNRQVSESARSKILLQGLNGISELKLFNRENFFVEKYDRSNKQFYEAQKKVQSVQQVQRYYIELVLILSIALLTLTVIMQGKSLTTILPSLALFLFAALRLIPSANKIIASLQSMRFTKPGLELVYEEFITFSKMGDKEHDKNKIGRIESVIRMKDVHYRYPSASQDALSSINLDIHIGSVTGIIGQSGSGKTTLINILTGLLPVSSGKIWVDQTDITGSMYELQQFIGYVPQHVFLIDDSLRRNIAFGIPDEAIDQQRLMDAIDAAQLNEVTAQLPEGIDSIIGERGIKLSGGQRQRIGIARALYHQPQVLILDEGTSALDHETETYIMESVARLKGTLTIILVAHRYSTLHFCDIVYKMQQGAIVAHGKLEELIN